MESEPFINLNYGNRSFELRRDNTFLYTFLGRLASRNHLFIAEDDQDDEDVASGIYMFRQGIEPYFDKIADYMRTNKYQSVENQQEVADCDEVQYQHYIAQLAHVEANDLDDGIPEGWK